MYVLLQVVAFTQMPWVLVSGSTPTSASRGVIAKQEQLLKLSGRKGRKGGKGWISGLFRVVRVFLCSSWPDIGPRSLNRVLVGKAEDIRCIEAHMMWVKWGRHLLNRMDN